MNRDYAEGLKHGHTDGESGDNKLPVRALKRLAKLDQLLPGATNRHAEYSRGYKQGNEDEQRLRSAAASGALSNITSQGNLMSTNNGGGQPRFDIQLEMLQHLKQYLQAFQEKLHTQSMFYQKKVDELAGDGIILDIHQKIEVEMQQTRQNLANVIAQIEQSDLPEVNKWIAYLESRPN